MEYLKSDTESLEGVNEDQIFTRQRSSQSAHTSEHGSPKPNLKTLDQTMASTPTKHKKKGRDAVVAALLAGMPRPRQPLIQAVEAMDVPKALKILNDEASFHLLDMRTLNGALLSPTRQVRFPRLLIAELIARGRYVNYISRDTSERTPLWNSVTNGSFDTVQLLLQNGADVNYTGLDRLDMFMRENGASDFASRAALQQDTSILWLLISAGLNVNAQYELRGLFTHHKDYWSNDLSLIHEAAFLGAVPAIQILLEHGAEVDASSRHGTALMLALLNGHEDAAQVLLDKGANPNFHAAIGHGSYLLPMTLQPYKNPIKAAMFSRKPSLVRFLLDRGVVVDRSTLFSAEWLAAGIVAYSPRKRHLYEMRDQEIIEMLEDAWKRGNQF